VGLVRRLIRNDPRRYPPEREPPPRSGRAASTRTVPSTAYRFSPMPWWTAAATTSKSSLIVKVKARTSAVVGRSIWCLVRP